MKDRAPFVLDVDGRRPRGGVIGELGFLFEQDDRMSLRNGCCCADSSDTAAHYCNIEVL